MRALTRTPLREYESRLRYSTASAIVKGWSYDIQIPCHHQDKLQGIHLWVGYRDNECMVLRW